MDKSLNPKLDKFFQRFKFMRFQKKEIILRPDEEPSGIYYLKKGLVRQSAISKTGEVLIMHIFRPGSFFQMMWAINHTPNTYLYEAITPVEVFLAPGRAVSEFIKKDPELLYDLTSRLLKGLDGFLKRMEYLVFDSAYFKTAALISYYARNFGAKNKTGIVIDVPLSHREIASWVGIARETVSLHMENLEKKGLISYHGRTLIINNLAGLENSLAIN